MKKFFAIIVLFAANLFALNVGGKDIQIGMHISVLDTNCFNVRLDSVGPSDITRSYKYIAYNKVPLNIANGFHRVTIEATPITGLIYNITFLNQIVYGYTKDGSEVDSMKKFFNENVKILESMYDVFDYSSDNNLPYKNFKNVNTNSMMFKFYGDITIYLSISDVGDLMTVQILFVDIELKKQGERESVELNERKIRKMLNNIVEKRLDF